MWSHYSFFLYIKRSPPSFAWPPLELPEYSLYCMYVYNTITYINIHIYIHKFTKNILKMLNFLWVLCSWNAAGVGKLIPAPPFCNLKEPPCPPALGDKTRLILPYNSVFLLTFPHDALVCLCKTHNPFLFQSFFFFELSLINECSIAVAWIKKISH